MPARHLFLSVLAGGPLLGLALGAYANADMKAPPEPEWRQARADPIVTESAPPTDFGAPVFAAAYDPGDRTPTWKRRALEREMALYEARYAAPEPLPPLDEPVPRPRMAVPTPLDAVAEERDAVRVIVIRANEAAEQRDAARAAAENEREIGQPAVIELQPATVG